MQNKDKEMLLDRLDAMAEKRAKSVKRVPHIERDLKIQIEKTRNLVSGT